MSQDGYTLAETMAALVKIGLAIGGLGQATFLIGRLNRATGAQVAADHHLGAAQRTLDDLLGKAGPFRVGDSQAFNGRAQSFDFSCDADRICGAELVTSEAQTTLVVRRRGRATAARSLGRVRNARFLYGDTRGLHGAWPAESDGSGGKPLLSTVVLVEGRDDPGRPLAVAAVWAQQAATCQFDSISGECREATP